MDAYHQDRRSRILAGVDVANQRGLEIGPHDRPLVHKHEGPVEYVDYTDTETLRAHAYAGVDPTNIPEVDHVWATRPLIEAVGSPVSYIVASHVIEHVPDLVGWLFDLRGALVPQGILGLAVPDRRFTFDLLRPESTLGDVVEAFLLRRRTPSLRHVFDNCALGVTVDHARAWREPLAGSDLPRLVGENALQFAYDQCVEIASTPRYIDSHCWIFTPASFLSVLEGLTRLKLAPFAVRSFTPTRKDDIEFTAQLTPADPEDLAAILASIEVARASLQSADRPEFETPPLPEPPAPAPPRRRWWRGLRR